MWTVRELMAALSKCDPDAEVALAIGVEESDMFSVERADDGSVVLEADQ
jgi:hypothetical protein